MSAATAIAIAAATTAAKTKHEVELDQCKAELPNFNPNTATVAEMKSYAKCVDIVYPSEIGPDTVLVLKVLFVVAIIGGCFGVWQSRKERGDSVDGFIHFVIAFFLALIAIGLVAGIVLGIFWLFS